MEPPPPPSTATTANGGAGKLRLMCSYSGHIVARPRSKALCYAGGDTRIVAIDRRTVTTLCSFVAHLSATLRVSFPFTLKYQLPHLDLDSLISLTSDDDFQILIDEYDRLNSTPPSSASPSRIRVFLFQTTNPLPGSGRPVIRHPKTEAWFFDALKGAKIVLSEAHGYASGIEAHGLVSSGPESMVLETSSSFGSTSSSTSLTNLPSLKSRSNENNEVGLQDSKVKLTPAIAVSSDNCVSNIMPHHQNTSHQDGVVHASSIETLTLESKIPNITSGSIIANNTNMEVGHTSLPQLNQVQRQHVQFVQPGVHFNLAGAPAVPAYRPMHQQQQALQHLIYHPNQPYPVYLVPLGQIPHNNMPTTASSQASLMNLNSSLVTTQASHTFRPANSATSFVRVRVPYDASLQQEIDLPPLHHQSHQSETVAVESPEFGNEHKGEIDRVQIYKSQPPPPSLPSQFRTVTKDTKILLSEGLAKGQDFGEVS